jgi:CHAD domain-containing protein
MKVLEQAVMRELHGEVERARAAVRSERQRRLVLKTALWLLDGNWSRTSVNRERDRTIVSLATRILDRRTKKVVKRADRFSELDAAGRHRLRIAIKKLRYANEFFESLFDHPVRKKRFTKILNDLQNSLGKLNDMAVHASRSHDIARSHRRSPKLLQTAYAMGFLAGSEKSKARALERAAEKAGKSLEHAGRFW